MKFGKTIKKVAALGMGLSFVGATMFGAMAADLSSYPSPFIKNGVFDGVLVVGTGGNDPAGLATDIIGVTDIVASLQYASTTSAGGASNTVTVTGDKWKVGTSSKVLELSEDKAVDNIENINDITSSIDSNELDILESGSINNNKGDFEYDQTIYFDNTATEYVMLMEDDDEKVADMFYIQSGDQIAKYELEFTSDLETDMEDSSGDVTDDIYLADLEDEDITIAGRLYTIVTARRMGDGTNDGIKLSLFGGAVKDTLEEGQTKTYTIDGVPYEVTALAITDSGTIAAKFVVNGESTELLKDGATDKLSDGTEIGVTELIPNEAGDVTLDLVEFFLGAQKLELQDDDIDGDTASSDEVKINGESLSEVDVVIQGTVDEANSLLKIQSIAVNMNADEDYYVAEGETLSSKMDSETGLFPGSWDIMYDGLTAPALEEIAVSNSGDDQYNLKFADGAGNMVSVPLVYVDGAGKLVLGEEKHRLHIAENKTIVKNDYLILQDTDGAAADGSENTWALKYTGASDNESASRVVKFSNVGSGADITESYPATAKVGDKLADLSIGGETYGVYAASSVAKDDFNVTVDLNTDGGAPQTGDVVGISTDAGAVIAINDKTTLGTPYVALLISEEDDGKYDDLTPTDLAFNITANAAGDEVDLSEVGALTFLSPEGEDDNKIAYTSLGAYAKIVGDTEGPDSLKIDWPKSQRVPLLYVTSEGSTVVNGGGAGAENVNINKIEVGAAKLDSELSDVTAQNVIAIGGACVNSATAKLAGVAPGTCGKAGADPIGLRENKAILKLMDQSSGKVALIVAGWRAEDTRRACKVLANYQDYVLSGKIMEVSGTTLSDIKVGAPVVEVATTTTVAVTTTTLAAQ